MIKPSFPPINTIQHFKPISGNKEDSNLIINHQEYGFNINFLLNLDNHKYNFKEKLNDLKFQITEYKEHFKKPCFNCSSSFHCSTFEDGHLNIGKMFVDRIECNFCQRYFTKERSFYHCCNICNASFNNCQLLFDHRKKEHQSKKQFQCVVCDLLLTTGNCIKKHALKHKLPQICPHCNKRYASKEYLKLHILRVCKPTSEKEFKCKLCPKEFYDKYKLKLHQHSHEKPFVCNFCNKRYTLRINLKLHSYIHTGDKPYNCSFCQKGFTSFKSFKRHEYLQVCTDNPRRDFKCNLCPKSFYTEERLSNHMLSHTGVKPFSCKYCPKRYTTKFGLDVHLFEHTGDKKFKCDLCNKTFAKQFLLNRHKFIHMKKSFQCTICSNFYKTPANLKWHVRQVHKLLGYKLM